MLLAKTDLFPSKSFKVLKNIHHYYQLTTKEKREEALMLDPLIHESHDRIVILALAVFNAGGVTASRLDLSRFVTIKYVNQKLKRREFLPRSYKTP
ncbi:hypothetical protein V6N12_020216 [Hibiscus sabdariffa]|uniref:Uncharacterized protein n=1 Tax=Hibiscus sabdariffa TaxID=183260 RepID=A0ABR2BPC9_9ROSI